MLHLKIPKSKAIVPKTFHIKYNIKKDNHKNN